MAPCSPHTKMDYELSALPKRTMPIQNSFDKTNMWGYLVNCVLQRKNKLLATTDQTKSRMEGCEGLAQVRKIEMNYQSASPTPSWRSY